MLHSFTHMHACVHILCESWLQGVNADCTVHTHTCAIYCLHVHTHIEHEARLQDFTWWARNRDKSLFAKRQALVSGVRPCNDRVLFKIRSYFYTYTYTSRSIFHGLTCYGASYTSDFYNPHCYPVETALRYGELHKMMEVKMKKWNLSRTLRLDVSQQWRNVTNKIHLGMSQWFSIICES